MKTEGSYTPDSTTNTRVCWNTRMRLAVCRVAASVMLLPAVTCVSATSGQEFTVKR